MKASFVAIAVLAFALASCDSSVTEIPHPDSSDPTLALTGPDAPVSASGVLARRGKMLVCHVGSDEGPGGETYDPACVPSETNGYFCPDAGRIDLIEVGNPAKHVGNPAHAYDGISDYEPLSMGASGVGKEDSDGDGVDDGCEIAEDLACPCFDEIDLLAITDTNLSPDACSGYVTVGGSGRAIFTAGELQIGYHADPFTADAGPTCGEFYPGHTSVPISRAEADVCVGLIETRCAEVENGGPILAGGLSTDRTRN